MTSAGACPRIAPGRSTAIVRTCSAWALESCGSPAADKPCRDRVRAIVAHDHCRTTFVGLASSHRIEIHEPDLTAQHRRSRQFLSTANQLSPRWPSSNHNRHLGNWSGSALRGRANARQTRCLKSADRRHDPDSASGQQRNYSHIHHRGSARRQLARYRMV